MTDLNLWVNLMMELSRYREDGVRLYLNEEEASPEEIADACVISESHCYMRDYVTDGEGELTALKFDKIDM